MSYYKEDGEINGVKVTVSIIVFILFVWVAILVVSPIYRVWSATKSGEAEYAQAEQNRRIKILEAQALKESAVLQAEAEVERARGVSQSNDIIADGLKDNEEYLRYLWINGLQTNNMQVIYVPTEAGLPILEAGRR